MNGPFFFGAADKLKDVMLEIAKPPKVLILRMRNVPAIDATGIHALEQMAKKCRAQGTRMILSEVRTQPLRAIVRAHKLEILGGRANLAPTLSARARRTACDCRGWNARCDAPGRRARGCSFTYAGCARGKRREFTVHSLATAMGRRELGKERLP